MTLRNRRRAAGLALALAAVLGGCGERIHRLDSPAKPVAGRSVSAASLSTPLVATDRTTTVGGMVAGDRPTVFVVAGEPCDGCGDAIRSLMATAFDAPAFSVVVIGVPAVPTAVVNVAVSTGAARFSAPHSESLLAEWDVTAYPALVVMKPDNTVAFVGTGAGAVTSAVKAARAK